jgi:hypothetical protein
MQARRVVSRVENGSLSIQLPSIFNHRQVEVIVLTLDEDQPLPVQRKPHPDIAGRVQIHGDIIGSVREQDWDLPR